MAQLAPVRASLPIRCLRLDAAVLTPTGKQVLAVMATFADAAGGRCFPSTEQLARETGLGQRTVDRALAHLRRIGALVPLSSIQDSYRKRQAREYRIAIDHLPATPRPGRASATVAEGLPPQTGGGFRHGGGPSSQRIESEEGEAARERASARPPDHGMTPAGPDPRARLRAMCARLGYSTRPDAVDELAEWLRGQGFRSATFTAAFLESAAKAILPTSAEARAKGLYLRHVRQHFEVWRHEDAEAVA